MNQVGTVLANYDDDVIEYVTGPQTGLQRTQKFAPVLAEIVEACNARVKALAQQAELEAWRERKRKSDEAKRLGGPTYSAEKIAGRYTYKEFLDYCEERKIPPRPIGRFESIKAVIGSDKPEDAA